MKCKSPTTDTMVVRLGLENFTTSQTKKSIFRDVEEGHMSDTEQHSNESKKREKQNKGMPINDDVSKPIKLIEKNIETVQMDPIYEINSQFAHYTKKDGRFYKFVKKHFLHRKGGPTNVQEIHILPEGDELRWARRSAGSGTSRSSEDTTSTEGDRLEVVHDMADEYLPEAV